MIVSINITFDLWKSLDLEFISPLDPEAQARLLNLGLIWFQSTDDLLKCMCHVIDKEIFLISVIKYGIEFEEVY